MLILYLSFPISKANLLKTSNMNRKLRKETKENLIKKQQLRVVYVVNEEAVEAVVILPANLEYLGKILAGEVEYKMIPLATFDIRDIDIVIRRAIYNLEDFNLAVSQRIDTDVQVREACHIGLSKLPTEHTGSLRSIEQGIVTLCRCAVEVGKRTGRLRAGQNRRNSQMLSELPS